MRRFILITLAAALLFPSQMTGKGFRWGLEWEVWDFFWELLAKVLKEIL